MDPRLMTGLYGINLTGMGTMNRARSSNANAGSGSFSDIFQQAMEPKEDIQFRISAHAQKRLGERHINMNSGLKESLNKAFSELESKGARDSLVVTREGAFVVNVPSRTLVTAMGIEEMRDGLVTNIDSVSMKY